VLQLLLKVRYGALRTTGLLGLFEQVAKRIVASGVGEQVIARRGVRRDVHGRRRAETRWHDRGRQVERHLVAVRHGGERYRAGGQLVGGVVVAEVDGDREEARSKQLLLGRRERRVVLTEGAALLEVIVLVQQGLELASSAAAERVVALDLRTHNTTKLARCALYVCGVEQAVCAYTCVADLLPIALAMLANCVPFLTKHLRKMARSREFHSSPLRTTKTPSLVKHG